MQKRVATAPWIHKDAQTPDTVLSDSRAIAYRKTAVIARKDQPYE